jgi:hypothetical protein
MRRSLGPLILLLALIPGALMAAPSARADGQPVQCWYENGALVIPAAFGDITGDFVLDASAPVSQLHETIAQAAGIEATTLTAELRIAGRRVSAFPIAVADLDARSVGFNTTINGVIGADLLQRFVVDIAFDPCRVTLHTRPPPTQRGAVRLKVTRPSGVAAITAAAFDGVRTRRGFFAIDTGALGVRLDPAETSFSRPLPPGLDPTLPFRPPARLAALSVAGDVFAATPAGLLEQTPPGLAGAIGDTVWSHYRLRLNLRAGWLELSSPAP